MDEQTRVTLQVRDNDVDDREIDELTRRLRQELLDLDVLVDGVRAGYAPPGAKSVELAALGTLVVTLSQSAVLAAIINAVSAWLGQRRQGTVRVEADGEVLELSGQPSQEQRRLTAAWLQRHETRTVGFVGNRHALIVANYDYQDPGLRQLRAPAHDAEQLARVLRDPRIGGFDVQVVLNESAPAINVAVEDFFADRGPDDLLLLYFSGHGVKDQDGELFFAAAPTKLSRLGATAVGADFVNRRMSRSHSRRIVLLLDCCYAGAFGRGMVARAGTGIALEEQFGGRGRAVITASSAMEYAFEGQDLADTNSGGSSVFTSAVIEGLDSGDADRDQDGYIGLDELYDYVYDRVRRSTPNQTPGKWTFDVQGDLYVARRSRPVTTPAPLPHELKEAIDHPLSGIRAGAVSELERLLKSRHEGLALAAKRALEQLTDDDSRSVALAAAAALGSIAAQVPDRTTTAVTDTAASTAVPEPRAVEGHEQTLADATHEALPSRPAPRPRTGDAQPDAAAELVTPRRESAARSGGQSRVVRFLTAGAAILLVLGFALHLGDPSEPGGLFQYEKTSATISLWLLVGCASALLLLPSGRRDHDVAEGATFGLAAGLLGLIAGLSSYYGYSYDRKLEVGFWITAAGAVLILAAVALATVPSRSGIVSSGAVVAVTLGVIGVGLAIIVPIDRWQFDGDTKHLVWEVLLGVAAVVLFVVAVVRTAQRRRAGTSRRAIGLGALSTALLVAPACWIPFGYYDNLFNAAYAPVGLIVLMAGALLGDDRPVPAAAARVSVALILLLNIPIGGNSFALPPTYESVQALFPVAAAALAIAALYVSRPRLSSTPASHSRSATS